MSSSATASVPLAQTTTQKSSDYRGLRVCCWCVAIVLGAANAWATRFTMNPDGISYLDLGDAWWRGDWHNAINAYWSPLYPWLLGLFLRVLKPGTYWEFQTAHLVNLLNYMFALACFEFFLRAFMHSHKTRLDVSNRGEDVVLPRWGWLLLGYSLFISISLQLISVRLITPDMAVAAFVFLGVGLLLKIRSGQATRTNFVLLGLVLGLAYLAKAAMFPLAFLFLAIALFDVIHLRRERGAFALGLVIFLGVAGSYATVLSIVQGHPTFGETGKLAYGTYVNGFDQFAPISPELKHGVREIFKVPLFVEFSKPIKGTYPLWYDPTYWHDGLKPHFDFGGQLKTILKAIWQYVVLLCSPSLQLCFTVGLAVLYLLGPSPGHALRRATAANWPCILLGISALSLYALVYTEYRYIGAFLVLLWMAAFSGVCLSPRPGMRLTLYITVVLMTVSSIALTASFVASGKLFGASDAEAQTRSLNYSGAVNSLHQLGYGPGDKLATISTEPFGEGGAFVARLARMQIVAQSREPEKVSSIGDPIKVQTALVIAGARAVLIAGVPPKTQRLNWHQLLPEDYYVCDLTMNCF